jgi:hypothetical protein
MGFAKDAATPTDVSSRLESCMNIENDKQGVHVEY